MEQGKLFNDVAPFCGQISTWRRASKAHAHHNSEEEKRRRKRASAKKRLSEQQLSVDEGQTNGATATSRRRDEE